MDIRNIPQVGVTCELTLKDIFGKPYTVLGRVAKEPYQNGYDCPSGAWALYQSKGDVPCYKIGFIPKGKRTMIVLNIKDIVSIGA